MSVLLKLPVTVSRAPTRTREAEDKLGVFWGLVGVCGVTRVPTLIPGKVGAVFPAMALLRMRIPPPVMVIPCVLPMMLLPPPVVLIPM